MNLLGFVPEPSLPSSALIDLHMELRVRAVLIWGYEPQPGVLVPLRLLGQNGLNDQAVAGMVDDSPR